MKDCAEYQSQISELLDGELTAEQTAELRDHITKCDACRAMYEAFTALSGALAPEEVPDTLHAGIMAKVALADKARRTQKTLIRLRPVLAAAACLVVVVGTVFALKNGLGASKLAAAPTESLDEQKMSFSAVAGAGAEMKTEEAPAAIEEPKEAPMPAPESESKADGMFPTATGNAADDRNGGLTGAAEEMRVIEVRLVAWQSESFTAVVTAADAGGIYAGGEELTVYTAALDPVPGEAAYPVGTVLDVFFSESDRTDGGAAVIAADIIPVG